MHLRSKLLLIMLVAVFPEVFASQSDPMSSGELTSSAVNGTQGKTAAGAKAEHAAARHAPVAGSSQTSAGVAGQGNGVNSAAYAADSRGQVVRGSRGECWRTGSWTPEQATVVGCDGVLAKALPVPAPTEPVNAVPPAKATPSETKPSAQTPKKSPAPSIAPVVPAAPPGKLSPEGEAGAIPLEPTSEKVTFDTDTFFDFDKSVLKPEGKQRLDTLVSQLRSIAVEVVLAVGHTDSTGNRTYNRGLSERRAKAVATYLQAKGVPKETIFTEGKGETQPMTSNASKAGRAKNRRVEIEVVGVRSKK